MKVLPTNLGDVEALVRNEVPESIHLDFKASPALNPNKLNEITKDVSAFANSDGGLLIYGVEEDSATHLPLRIDSGVGPKWNREWLEQILVSHITPRIEGIQIAQFSLPSGGNVVCVGVPKSFCGPHQTSDHRYYKRFNFASFPMEHYEIEDVRNRTQIAPHLISIDLKTPSEDLLIFVLRNIGNIGAYNIRFDWSKDMQWPSETPPHQFEHGIKFFGAGRELLIYCHGKKVFDWNDKTKGFKFDIEVSYEAATFSRRTTDIFHFDINDYRSTLVFTTEEKIERHISEIVREMSKITQAIKHFDSPIFPTNRGIS